MNDIFFNIFENGNLFDDYDIVINRNRKSLRFIYQMAASPIYGTQLRKVRTNYDVFLDKYSERLSIIFNCSRDITYPTILLYMSAILDYAVWGEKEKLKSQIKYISRLLNN